MRRFLAIAAMVLLLVLSTGCSVPCRLNNFVNRTERRAYRYSIRDWEYSLDRYQALVTQYVRNYTRYTTAEKRMAMDAIGRYHGLLVKAGLREGAGIISELRQYAGALQDILANDVGAFIDFLRDVLGLGDDRIIELRGRLDKEFR
ncbi:MAG: hypothetical protein J5693_04615 [Bacteroidales bacterium]|nr:hypothetical protein [Bacteroidales bacterium]